uniref:Uncharacterized protein n=1 Tax=Anguilla anguilla TaxID=7936 RepID=A0A0E9QS45_ANGAN
MDENLNMQSTKIVLVNYLHYRLKKDFHHVWSL